MAIHVPDRTGASRKPLDPVTTEVISNRLNEIVNVMQYVIYRTGYSTIVRESKDTSAAITDRQGRMVGQATQHPFHMAVFGPTVGAILERYPYDTIHEGDSFIVNDPYIGGSPHVPDFIVATPAFFDGQLIAFCLDIAHKSDVGGLVPGSSSGGAREIFHEGLLVPPVRYVSDGMINTEVEAVIRNNSRTPDLVSGDLRGQVGCTTIGVNRMKDLCEEYGLATVLAAFEEVPRATERRLASELATWPDGVAEAKGYLDHDGVHLDKPVQIKVKVFKKGSKISFDFTECADQTVGPINIRPPLVRSACFHALITMIDPAISNNDGVGRVVETVFRDGSVVNPRNHAPVNHYTNTLSMVSACALAALGQLAPYKAVAAAGGKMAMALGGRKTRTGRSYVQYEILGSAYGGRSTGDGPSALDTDTTNCLITPVEIIETEFPVRLRRFELRPDSGGPGRYRGGLGFVREYEILEECIFTLRSSQHVFPAWGAFGGKPGATAGCAINPGTPQEQVLPSITGGITLRRGDILRVERPGGGGYGPPEKRDPDMILEDVLNGYVSLEGAGRDYGAAGARGIATMQGESR